LLLDLIQKDNNFNTLYHELTSKNELIVHGLTNSAKSFILANIFKRLNKHLIFIVNNHHEALTYYREIKNLLGESFLVSNFPCQEISPYDQINSDVSVTSSQYQVFSKWQEKDSKSLTVITFKAFTQMYIEKALLEKNSLIINPKLKTDPLEIARRLIELGYSKQFMVENRGQFSHRGDILDIYPLQGEPTRIEFFGDDIESIRTFSVHSQRSIQKVETLTIHPRFSIIRQEEDGLEQKILARVKEYSTSLEQEAKEGLELSLASQIQENPDSTAPIKDALYWEGVEYYKSFLGQGSSSLFEYLPAKDQVHLIFDEWQDLLLQNEQWQEKIKEQYKDGVSLGKLIPIETNLFKDWKAVAEEIKAFPKRLYIQNVEELTNDSDSLSLEILSYPAERFASKVEDFTAFIKENVRADKKIVIFSEQPQRVIGILKEWDIQCLYLNANQDLDELPKSLVIVLRDGLEEGCKIPGFDLVILTDRELFGRSRQAVAKQKNQKTDKELEQEKQKRKNAYTDIADLNRDDYVIHFKHGLGIYRGNEIIELSGIGKQEYLAVEYAGEARVLIPVDQVNLLSRFDLAGDLKPKLSKLGGNEWTRTKKKVRKSVKKIAQDLVALYARRAQQTGHLYQADTPWQLEMEDAFPYDETVDQLKAIVNVKSDMESEKLMDRLICGDAGFGKTEVIIRAIFKVIMEGKQVAVLVPTTVLAQQHFNVMRDRYAPYPLKMGLLSRFKSAKEQKETIRALKTGECDLVIGTHRLLQKDIQFKDLGLLIIDEEQRFGVSHKEKLKDLRKDLDVISMSATPIPRTLHMSLSGIKDISLIATAPTNRLPVKTFVGEYKSSVVRNAILHEIERGGKIFFLHNRVETIQQLAFEISELVPEASVRVAHGQMKPQELEDTMFAFISSEFHVLVCTTIIETGLDISDANTIIINHANTFGLSQLYQLRGRVGRSDTQAYAYLLYNSAADISETARQRLKAIKELNNLGSGYQVALRDMEIRGVGNVFGGEQHGHMVAVGASLYFKMLSDAISEVKGEKSEMEEYENSCVIDMKISAFFPQTWIDDEHQRMNEYKRLSIIDNEEDLNNIIVEWSDRFGRLPPEAKNLIEISNIKLLANKKQIASICEEQGELKIFANLRLQKWLMVQRQLPPHVQSKTAFKPGSFGGAKNSQSYIVMKSAFMETEAKLEALKKILEIIEV
jgi:transcription-repair coupling factor (superfamily II helicase)